MKKIHQSEEGSISEEMLGEDLEIEADVENLPL